jgi:hypothetical protein
MKDMQDTDLPELQIPSMASVVSMMGVWLRALCSVVGVLVLALGVYLSARVFYSVYDVSTHPEQCDTLVSKWGEVAGGPEALKVQVVPGETVELSRLAGVGILGGAAFLLGILSCTMMVTGARIICWTTSDRQAVKAIVEYALERRSSQGP